MARQLRERHAFLLLGGATGLGLMGLMAVGLVASGGAQMGSAPMELEAVADQADDVAPTSGARRQLEKKKRAKPRAGLGAIGRGATRRDEAPAAAAPMMEADKEAEGEDKDRGAGSAESGAVRAWFPESFLWRPHVQTSDDGVATVSFKVPDQLTEWRVLALAHSAEGEQAGAVHSFHSSLPLYVDPVVPGWLTSGDALLLPLQLVNGGDAAATAQVRVSGGGALAVAGERSFRLGVGASEVWSVPSQVEGAGVAVVRVTASDLGTGRALDQVVREIPVQPKGRKVERRRAGRITQTASVSLTGIRGADPSTEELVVWVYPGPLAVLQQEVERVQDGATPLDGMLGFALAGHLQRLSAASGVDLDPKAQRTLRWLSWQRVVRMARAPNPGVAVDLLAAIRDVEGLAPLEPLRRRLVRTVVQGQRADGSWARQDRGTLQQVVVQTAFAARALPQDAEGPRLRASGAIERYQREIRDPYSAAMVLASGLARGAAAERLQAQLLDALVQDEQGHDLRVPADVDNPWGFAPSQAELRAVGALALAEAEPEIAGELVARLMQDYDVRVGFGAGPADGLALEAVARLLPVLDAPVEVRLSVDGTEVASGSLDPSQPLVPAVLQARPGAQLELSLSTAVPGLSWQAVRRGWLPWTGRESLPGVEVTASASRLQVGEDGKIVLTLAAPSSTEVSVEQGLPAGATVDLAALRRVPGVDEVRGHTDRVWFRTHAFSADEVLEVPITVRPAFAGRFSTGPLHVEAGYRSADLAPLTWVVRPGAGS